MGYVKRKCSNAGKVAVPRFNKPQADFLADVQAEVVMNEIPLQLIPNWDQTTHHLVLTGQWTMNKSGKHIVTISNSDDKRQITAVLAVTMSGEYLPPQLTYKGKTVHCHPKGGQITPEFNARNTTSSTFQYQLTVQTNSSLLVSPMKDEREESTNRMLKKSGSS